MSQSKSQMTLSKTMRIARLLAGILVGFFAVIMFSTSVQAQAEDTYENRLAAAKRYAQAFDVSKTMNDSVQQMARQVPPEKRQKFIDFMKTIDNQRIEAVIIEAMVKQFTADELVALADFYGTAVGQSVIKKFPRYIASIVPEIQSIVIEKARQFPK